MHNDKFLRVCIVASEIKQSRNLEFLSTAIHGVSTGVHGVFTDMWQVFTDTYGNFTDMYGVSTDLRRVFNNSLDLDF